MACLKLLRGRGVCDARDGGLSLASFRSVSKISMPTTTAGSPRAVVTGETRQYLENGMERMLRSKQEISEMKERLGIIPHGQNFGLQSEALFTLIEVVEVREHAVFSWWTKQGKRYND